METTFNSKNVITVTNLGKNFGVLKAVGSIHFEVKQGTTTALLGGNGVGKTTTIAMLLGLLLPSGGEIRILNENIIRHGYRVLKHINLTSPYLDLPGRLLVWENLIIYARLYNVADRTVAKFGRLNGCNGLQKGQ